jgi:hypothetical protein
MHDLLTMLGNLIAPVILVGLGALCFRQRTHIDDQHRGRAICT